MGALSEIIQSLTLAGVAAILSALWTWYSHRNAATNRRAEWLRFLHERFGIEKYSRMRRLTSYGRAEDDMARLSAGNLSDPRTLELRDELSEYLDFFDFVGHLTKLRQVTVTDIDLIFGYYLEAISKHGFLLKMVHEEFGGVEYLLKKLNLPDDTNSLGTAE